MKAMINVNNRVSLKQKQAIREYTYNQQRDMMRRFFKLMCYVFNEEFGFGKSRLLKVVGKINELSTLHKEDEEFWYHLDKRIIEQMDIPFEKEKYEEINYDRKTM